MFVADLTCELRAWPTDTWAKLGVLPEQVAQAVIGCWQDGEVTGLQLDDLSEEGPLSCRAGDDLCPRAAPRPSDRPDHSHAPVLVASHQRSPIRRPVPVTNNRLTTRDAVVPEAADGQSADGSGSLRFPYILKAGPPARQRTSVTGERSHPRRSVIPFSTVGRGYSDHADQPPPKLGSRSWRAKHEEDGARASARVARGRGHRCLQER